MTRGIIVHGALLLIMLVYGYRTWTKEEVPERNVGKVNVWKKDAGALTLMTHQKVVRTGKLKTETVTKTDVQKRKGPSGDYWWATETRTTTRQVKKKPPEVKDEASASSGSSAASSASSAAAEPEMETETTTSTSEFPLKPEHTDLPQEWANPKALKALGKFDESKKEAYKFEDDEEFLSFTFGGEEVKLVLGGRVPGSLGRYVMNNETQQMYAMSSDVLNPLAGGRNQLALSKFVDVPSSDIEKVTFTSADGKSTTIVRSTKTSEKTKKQVEIWANTDAPGVADEAATNFYKKIDQVRPSQFKVELDPAALTMLVKVQYFDKAGKSLGETTFYKMADSTDPAAATPMVNTRADYFGMSPNTHVPAKIGDAFGKYIDENLPQIFTE